MAKSAIEEIMDDPNLDDEGKKDALYTQLNKLVEYLVYLRKVYMDEINNLDLLMDANGNNKDEHHAKTMVFYGRKLAARDLIQGVKETDPSRLQPPEVAVFTGIDKYITDYDKGRIPISWNCWKGFVTGSDTVVPLDNIWKTVDDVPGKPATEKLEQMHTLGSKVRMPTIQNLDTDGVGQGTNTYKVKSGYTINGWAYTNKIDNTDVQYFRYDDNGNDWLYKNPTAPNKTAADRVRDIRIFAFGTDSLKLPFNETLAPDAMNQWNVKNPAMEFVLSIVPIWFTIKFVVRHAASIGTSAPCRQDIKTRLGNTIKFPLTTLITMENGYEISTEHSPYGSWTTVDPDTPGVPQRDPDGDPIADRYFNADSEAVVGSNDFDAGIRYLYLEIKSTSAPTTPSSP